MTVAESASPQHAGGRWLADVFTDSSAPTLATLRTELDGIGFAEAQICARTGISSIYDLATLGADTPMFNEADALAVAVRLFIASKSVAWPVVRSAFPPQLLEALSSVGLLLTLPADGAAPAVPEQVEDQCVATISLYPIEGILIAADRHATLTPVAVGLPADVVYTAMTQEARQFIQFMPREACDDYLELCSGTGIAALIAARSFAKHATGVDVTDRSTRFAAFNAGLNRLENTSFITGDLYEPVAGRTFDLITAHPPYVPAVATTMVYRDGGEDGEGVTRRIVAGLPAHLRPGGFFYCSCMMTDRKDQPIEARIRGMLGSAENEFDVLAAQGRIFDVPAHMLKQVEAGELPADEAAALRQIFADLKVERFVGVVFVVHRRVSPSSRAPITSRRVLSTQTSDAHLLWYLKWRALSLDFESDPARFLDARPSAGATAELRSRSVLRSGRWSVTHAALLSRVPFEAEGECPPWFATLLGWCDGRVTAREHLARLRDLEFVAPSLTDESFGIIVQKLADGGLMDLDICPLPRSPAVSA